MLLFSFVVLFLILKVPERIESNLNITKPYNGSYKELVVINKDGLQRLMVRGGQNAAVKCGIMLLFLCTMTDCNTWFVLFCFIKENFGNKNPDIFSPHEQSHFNSTTARSVHLLLLHPFPVVGIDGYCHTGGCSSIGSTEVSLLFSCSILSFIIS